MYDSKRQIKNGAIISYIALGINVLASLVYLPWMVKMIGKSNYALYTLASSFISLFLMDFGLSASVSRFVAKYNAEGKQDKIDEIISTIARLYIVIDTIILSILLILYIFIGEIYSGLTPEEIRIFKQLYIIVAVYSIVSFPFIPLGGILNAYELFIQQKCAELFNKIFSITLIVLSLLCGGDVRMLVVMHSLAGIVIICLKIFFVKRKTRVKFKFGSFNKKVFFDVAKFSVWVTVMSLAQRCIFNLAPSIMGIVSNSTEIAIFAPANALEGYFYTVSAAVNGLFLPTVSRYIANNEDEKIFPLMVRVGRYQFLVMGLVYIEFLCIGKDFVVRWMGEDFIKAWPCALILFTPDIMLFSQEIANTAVIAKNKVKQQAIGYIIMAISCVALSFPLSKILGSLGACIAIAFGYSMLFVYMNTLYYKQLEINVYQFYKNCYIKLGLPMIVIGTISFYLCSKITFFYGWIAVFLKGIIVFALFFVVTVFFLDNTEKDFLKNIMIRRR